LLLMERGKQAIAGLPNENKKDRRVSGWGMEKKGALGLVQDWRNKIKGFLLITGWRDSGKPRRAISGT